MAAKLRSDCLPETADSVHVTARKNMESMLRQQNAWAYSEKGMEALRASMTMLSTKTGMFARIPLICKENDCPYSQSCMLLRYTLAPRGEYCPMETAWIEKRYFEYDKDYDLDNGSATDMSLITEIITCEMIMERCKSLMAKEETPVVLSDVGINERGDIIQKQEVSKAFEAYEKARKARDSMLQLMNGTRKDKKDIGKQRSVFDILSDVATMEDEEIHDAEFKETEKD